MADVKSLFDNSELPVFIIISTLLQICLILWTHLRKQSSSQPVRRIVGLAVYMAADFVATLCLGGIFNENMTPNPSQDSANKNKYLLALWSPFILLHLGSHSKMTACSLEDNEFWLGHLLRFVFHEATALIICILASTEIQVRSLSIILFITGTVKFFERILALKRGSMTELRSSTFKKVDPGLSIQDLVRIAASHIDANRRGDVGAPFRHDIIINEMDRERAPPLVIYSRDEDVRTLCAAYKSFTKNKGIFVDALFMWEEPYRVDEGTRFADMDDHKRLEILETELSFAHDLFYTKTALTHTICGWIVRILSLTFISLATGLFFHINKHGFQQPDVQITFGLLIAALIFEVLGFLESLTSNHTIVQVGFLDGGLWRFIEYSIGCLHRVRRTIKGFLCPKCNSVGQFNVLRYGYSDSKSSTWLKKLLDFLALKELWDRYYHTTYTSSDDDSDRKIRIINEVRERLVEPPPQGVNTTFHTLFSQQVSSNMNNTVLQENIQKEFEECILIWHIATHLCSETVPVDERPATLQDAMFLSDYMLYLLTVHPSTVSSVATTELTSYRKACAASVQLYNDYTDLRRGGANELYTTLGERKGILDYAHFGQERNFFLLDGYKVAETLKRLEDEQQLDNGENNRWELLFRVWVDVLSYAAYHCKGKCHAEQLGTGGQFLTTVWLFMVHFILDSHYEIEGDQNRDGQ